MINGPIFLLSRAGTTKRQTRGLTAAGSAFDE